VKKINLILGDCIDVLRHLPDKSIDCIVTDPPYGVGFNFGAYKDDVTNLKKLVIDALPHMLRVAQRAVIIPGIRNLMLYPQPTWILSYLKDSAYCPWGFNRWHPVLLYGADPDLPLRMRRTDIITNCTNRSDPVHGSIAHPTPKPLALMRKLINRVAPSPSDTILVRAPPE
jgi:site-specific DNA-methyltransferase (adenine-specific)